MINRLFSSRYFLLIYLPISFLFLLIYSWATSPLYLGDGIDSSIFKTIGLGIYQGKLPYVDLFDHKGGLFFMIQSLGWFIAPGRWGLFILQVIFLTVTLIIMHKTACLITDRKKAFLATMATMMLYLVFMESGNQCETYMLPFTGLTFYLAVKYLTGDPKTIHPALYSAIYGLCFAVVFWIRPNDAVSQTGSVMTGIFIFMLVRKAYAKALLNAATFIGGCAIVTLPLIGFFAHHGCVHELLEGTFLYNMKYASDSGLPSIQMILVPLFVFGFLIWMAVRHRQGDLNFIFIPMLVLTLLLIGKRNFGHYLIIISIPAVLLFSFIIKEKWRAVMIILLLAIAVLSIRPHKYVIKSVKTHEHLEAFFQQTERMIDNIPENERDSVWNLNLLRAAKDNRPKIFSTLNAFMNSGITPCNRVFVYFHLPTFPESETVRYNMPKWILADPTDNGFDNYEAFLNENYTVIDSTDGTCVADVVLYRRKHEGR